MLRLFYTSIGRLRLLAFAEGASLLFLVFVAVPVKYFDHNPALVRNFGPVHGALFLLFVLSTLRVSVEQGWKFKSVTARLLLACIIPFGTFYAERKFLRNNTSHRS